MTKKVFLIALMVFLSIDCKSQEKDKINHSPKLVVGIVVDQMRYDYLTRFYDRFGEGGFKRMINDGYNCKNNHFNYVPTYTGPGHASVYTGTTPQNHGIISNNWYDKFAKEEVYCASDPAVKAVGSDSEMERMSPHRMKTTTVSDQNRLHTQLRGKTIGIAIKDRGAILPAGHTANGAYWFRGKDEGKWITSTYYRNELPDWVQKFNASGKAKSYFKVWNTLYDIKTYKESGSDENTFERGYEGKETATFPYDLAKLKDQNRGYDIIKESAYGNSLTADFAIAAIDGEQMGSDEVTDFLTVSFSSTDYVGHNFGVNSKEIEDTYLRLDKDLERFFNALDSKVGKGQYTVFLTADHGAVHVPSYLKSVKIPAGYFDSKKMAEKIQAFVKEKFKAEDLMENASNNQIFFNYSALQKYNIDAEELQKALAHFILQEKQIDKVFTRSQLENGNYTSGIAALLQKGFNQKRSGDIIIVFDPATIMYSLTGSTHGSGLTYDTHAPLLFYGQGIRKGSTTAETHITDIAPTISALLGIAFPNGATGDVLPFVLD
ncbi:alkaline phosphatase PafA [Aquimarina sp. MMG016]|uniref:alkaline phosphatase PafA n=1 Tax=Aquimarina sp. MMG016 TaxID=2822690 RepID=UPI001B3A44EE|nr:alkaline phosphatase PafA [Aquimarina sp. MMG016]MBQ4821526.1 alkaline phosphatase family protein [Aquimarina sp. MMG016]